MSYDLESQQLNSKLNDSIVRLRTIFHVKLAMRIGLQGDYEFVKELVRKNTDREVIRQIKPKITAKNKETIKREEMKESYFRKVLRFFRIIH